MKKKLLKVEQKALEVGLFGSFKLKRIEIDKGFKIPKTEKVIGRKYVIKRPSSGLSSRPPATYIAVAYVETDAGNAILYKEDSGYDRYAAKIFK